MNTTFRRVWPCLLIGMLSAVLGCHGRAVKPVRTSQPTGPRLFTAADLPHLMLRAEEAPEGSVFRGLTESPPGAKHPEAAATWGRKGREGKPDKWELRYSLSLADSPGQAEEVVREQNMSVAAVSRPAARDSELSKLGDHVWYANGLSGWGISLTRENLVARISVFNPAQPKLEDAEAFARVLDRKLDAALAGRPEPAAVLPLGKWGWEPPIVEKNAADVSERPWGDKTVTVGVQVENGFPRALPALRVDDDYLIPLTNLIRVLGLYARYGATAPDQPTVDLGGGKLFFRKGRPEVMIGGQHVALGHPVEVVDGKVMAPLSLVQAVFGLEVKWTQAGGIPVAQLHIPDPALNRAPLKLLPQPNAEDMRAEHPYVQVAKRVYGFESWPRGSGKVRPGLNVRAATAGLGMKWEDWQVVWAREGEGVPSLTWVGQTAKGRYRQVRIWVAPTPALAREVMAGLLSGEGSVNRSLVVPLEMNSLGEISASFREPLPAVFFVRDNVAIFVSTGSPEESPLDTARALDAALQAVPAVASLEAYAPQIQALKLDGKPFPSRLDLSVPGANPPGKLTAVVTSPRGGRLSYAWIAASPLGAFPTESREVWQLVVHSPVCSWTPEKPYEKGKWNPSQVSLLVIDEDGLSAEKTVAVEVKMGEE